jgi:hypothetical protein
MCVRPIEPDASISSMMFGFTRAAVVVTIGVLAMSVCAACAAPMIDIARTTATRRAPRLRSVDKSSTCFMMGSRLGDASALTASAPGCS